VTGSFPRCSTTPFISRVWPYLEKTKRLRMRFDPVATAPGSDLAHADARAATVSGMRLNVMLGWDPVATEAVKKLLDPNITQVTEIRRLGRGQSIGSRCDRFKAPPPQVSEASSSNQPFNAVNSGWVETWRLSVNYSVGVATRYSTASEATGCRHSIITRTLKTLVEWRHPVASLAVLYWVAIMLVSFLTRLTFHTVSTARWY